MFTPGHINPSCGDARSIVLTVGMLADKMDKGNICKLYIVTRIAMLLDFRFVMPEINTPIFEPINFSPGKTALVAIPSSRPFAKLASTFRDE